MEKMKVMATRVPVYQGAGIEIRILVDADGTHSPAYIQFATMHTIERGMLIPPALTISDENAQALCDALWDAGIRPTNGAGSVGQLAAVQAHLGDMRKIVESKLKVTL